MLADLHLMNDQALLWVLMSWEKLCCESYDAVADELHAQPDHLKVQSALS